MGVNGVIGVIGGPGVGGYRFDNILVEGGPNAAVAGDIICYT